jgi:hypothetical protein
MGKRVLLSRSHVSKRLVIGIDTRMLIFMTQALRPPMELKTELPSSERS